MYSELKLTFDHALELRGVTAHERALYGRIVDELIEDLGGTSPDTWTWADLESFAGRASGHAGERMAYQAAVGMLAELLRLRSTERDPEARLDAAIRRAEQGADLAAEGWGTLATGDHASVTGFIEVDWDFSQYFVELTLVGTVTGAELREAVRKGVALLREHRGNLWFFDMSGAATLSRVDVAWLAGTLENTWTLGLTRVAILVPEGKPEGLMSRLQAVAETTKALSSEHPPIAFVLSPSRTEALAFLHR